MATVEVREMTGVGFSTRFAVPPAVTRLNAPGRRVISDVGAQLAGLENGAGFLLFIQDGRLVETPERDLDHVGYPSATRAMCDVPTGGSNTCNSLNRLSNWH